MHATRSLIINCFLSLCARGHELGNKLLEVDFYLTIFFLQMVVYDILHIDFVLSTLDITNNSSVGLSIDDYTSTGHL